MEKSTRERIIAATIDFIEKYGIHAVTIRGIAKAAGVNSAAINYYFRSKENLLDETLKLTMKHLQFDLFNMTEKEGQSPGELLQMILFYFLAGSMKFPGITKAHLYGLFVNNDENGIFAGLFKSFIGHLADKLGQIDPGRAKEDIRMSVAQLFSAVLLPCIFPDMFKESVNLDFKDVDMQRKYIHNFVNRFYPVDKEPGDWHPLPLNG